VESETVNPIIVGKVRAINNVVYALRLLTMHMQGPYFKRGISLLNSVYSYQIRIMSQGQVRRHDGWFDYVKRYKGGLWLVLGVKLNNACPPCKQYATLDCARIEHSYLLITSHDTILPYYG